MNAREIGWKPLWETPNVSLRSFRARATRLRLSSNLIVRFIFGLGGARSASLCAVRYRARRPFVTMRNYIMPE